MRSEWDLLQQVFTVQTIMTPWSSVATIAEHELEDDSPVLRIADYRHYSFLPVMDGARVTGILEVRGRRLHHLTADWLISRDTPIPALIELFVRSSSRAFLVIYGQDTVGLVSLADINKMPTRIYLFNLVAELETALAAAISAYVRGEDEVVLRVLEKPEIVRNYVAMAPSMRGQDLDIGILQQLNLSDLVNFLRKTPELYQAIGFASGNHVKVRLNGLVELRHRVAHAVRPLVTSSDEIAEVSKRIQEGRAVLDWLAQYAKTRAEVTLPLQLSLPSAEGNEGLARPTDT